MVGKTHREVAARAQFMIGELQFQQKKFAEAVKSFFKVSLRLRLSAMAGRRHV